jgi:hypothetical protein
MLCALVALGTLVVLKGVFGHGGGNPPDGGVPVETTNVEGAGNPPHPVVPAVTSNPPAVATATNQGKPPVPSVVAMTPAQEAEARVDKEMDKIKQAMLEGNANPQSFTTIRERFIDPDPEVRRMAIDAAGYLNDREAIPFLEKALAKADDPREKVAILDAIEYLKLPHSDEMIPPEGDVNPPRRTNGPPLAVRPPPNRLNK